MRTLDWDDFGAVLFDLDGVLTSTATLHAAAWKHTFDHVLAELVGPDTEGFDMDLDYRRYVDGKPRYQGVAAFLASRGIDLPPGEVSDPPGTGTICAIGNLKNQQLATLLDRDHVRPFPGSVALVDHLAERGMALGVVSSSANAARVLEAAGLADRFQVRVDGVVASAEGLAGKPSPETFLEAARRLDVEPARTVVVEDAVAGVEAGVAGGFGAVVGVDRHGDSDMLRAAGADVVVADLGELVP